MKFGVIVFPGSNCDHDCYHVVAKVLGEPAAFIWHKEADLRGVDVVVLPGGFSYGDYLRSGAIARFSPIMDEVMKFAQRGGKVWGICNGFQVLLECGLLEGAMMRNESLRFVCDWCHVRVENADTPYTRGCPEGDVLRIPVAHGEGNYYADANTLAALEEEGRVVFRYSSKDGDLTSDANPNGSLNNIAGIINQQGNVMGMMPHPERCAEDILGSSDGLRLFESLTSG